MKRTFLILSVFISICSFVVILTLWPLWSISRAQQAPTDEISLQLLPVPPNVIGTFVQSASNDGKRIAFASINDYNGKNVDSNTEIWVYDVDKRSIIMITDTKDLKNDPADANKITLTVNNETPVISGDGTKIVFVSNAELGGAKNEDGNFEIYLADLPRDATEPKFRRLTDTGADFSGETVKEIFGNYSPTINDNGSMVAFLSTRKTLNAIPDGPPQFTAHKEGPNNADPDGNGEIFILNVASRQYSQATVSRDVDATVNFTVKGFNSSPHLSGDGKTLAFISGFNYPGPTANKNADFNGEIFLYKIGDSPDTFTQVTDSKVPLATETPIIVPILTQDGVNYTVNGSAPMNLMPAFARPLNREGTLLVFESAGNFDNGNADKTRELWVYNVISKAFTRITNQTVADPTKITQDDLKKIDHNFRPSINSTGTHITFASVLNLTPATTSGIKADNADGSREVFRFEIASAKFRQITFADKSGAVLDQRDAGVSPFIDDTGTVMTFSLDASLVAPRAAAIAEPFQALVRPVTSRNSVEAKLANAASFEVTQIARGSIAAVFGTQLAVSTASAPSANLPFVLNGVSVNVDGLAARLIFVSDGQVNVVIPPGVNNGDALDFTINNNGIVSAGKVKMVDAAPGVFSSDGTGKGATASQCGRVAPDGLSFIVSTSPCSVGNSSQADQLIIYGTGWRNATGLQVKIGDQTLTPTFSGPQPDFLGFDQINLNLTTELAGKENLEITVTIPGTTPIDSNKTTISFLPFEVSLTVANAASSEAGTVGRDSQAVAIGESLANTVASSPVPVLEIAGVKMTVAGAPALISYVSPTLITFILGENVKPADLVEVTVNNNGTVSRGRVKVLNASPGIFTDMGDGNGRARAECGRLGDDGSFIFTNLPPCAVGTEAAPNLVRVFGTGWRNGEFVTLRIGDTDLVGTFFGGLDAVGVDIIDAKLVPSLAGKTDVDVIVKTTTSTVAKDSKAGVKISFLP